MIRDAARDLSPMTPREFAMLRQAGEWAERNLRRLRWAEQRVVELEEEIRRLRGAPAAEDSGEDIVLSAEDVAEMRAAFHARTGMSPEEWLAWRERPDTELGAELDGRAAFLREEDEEGAT